MNEDGDTSGDGQDDETPEEMVNRSLAEALENQQMYMEMFQNSASMLQVLTRFMADPIVVHDLEIMSDDESTSSSLTPTSPSPTSPSQTRGKNDNEISQSTTLCRVNGASLSGFIPSRVPRINSARPQQLGASRGRYRAHNIYDPILSRAGCTPYHFNGGAGDNAHVRRDSPKEDPAISKTPEKNNETTTPSLQMASTSCQTQHSNGTDKTEKTKADKGIPDNDASCDNIVTKLGEGSAISNHSQQVPIGVGTQTSINSAMSEISKAADTIRRARNMLSSLNLGTAGILSSSNCLQQQSNNNNHKKSTESDNAASTSTTRQEEDDEEKVTKSFSPTKSSAGGDGDDKPKENQNPSQQLSDAGNVSDKGFSKNSRKPKSNLVRVKPLTKLEDDTVSHEVALKSELGINNNDKSTANNHITTTSAVSRSNSGGSVSTEEVIPLNGRRRSNRNDVVVGIGGASVSTSTDFDSTNCFMEGPENNQRIYQFETNKVASAVGYNNATANNTTTSSLNETITLTIEMFQCALDSAIENLKKEGLWHAINEYSDKNDSLLRSKVNTNCFVLPNLDLSLPETIPYHTRTNVSYEINVNECPCPCVTKSAAIQTSIVAFEHSGASSEDDGLQTYSSFASNKKEDELRFNKESDVESTFGHCSSVHISAVVSFDANEETTDEDIDNSMLTKDENVTAFNKKENRNAICENFINKTSLQKTSVVAEDIFSDHDVPQKPVLDNCETIGDQCTKTSLVPSKENVDKSGIRGEGDESRSPRTIPSCSGVEQKNTNNKDVTLPNKNKQKTGIFRRLTSAIRLCSSSKKT